jgi:predicted SAM-dependent methyltransferase
MAPEQWVNIDRSPSVLLSRVPGLLPSLGRLHLIPAEQASGTWPENIRRHDVERGLPFPAKSAEAIYSSHMLEHLAHDSALRVLRECRRVVRDDGVVRIAVPDFAEMVARYNEDTDADLFIRESLMGVEVRPRGLRRLLGFVTGAKHKWLYDERSLGHLFEEAGFARTARFGYREGRLPDLDTIETRDGSLFMEAYLTSG